jgi:hypothetical protein
MEPINFESIFGMMANDPEGTTAKPSQRLMHLTLEN